MCDGLPSLNSIILKHVESDRTKRIDKGMSQTLRLLIQTEHQVSIKVEYVLNMSIRD